MSVSVAWRCRLYHIIMPRSSHTLWLNTAPQDSLLSLVTQHSLDQIQLSPSLLISSHSGNPLVVGVLLRLCLFQYTQIHTQMEKCLFRKRWCIKVTHRLEVDFSLSRQKKGRSLGQRDSISACGSEIEVQNREEKEKQRSVGRSAWLRAVVETMRTILLRTSRCSQRVHTLMLWWMSVSVATKTPMSPTGQTCIKINFYFFETHALTQLSITRVKNLCHQECETAGGYEKNVTLVFVC